VRENLRVIGFAVVICLACSILVSSAAIGLRDRQEANLQLDIRKNILKSVGLYEGGQAVEEVNRIFDEEIVALVIDRAGNVVEGKTPDDVDPAVDTDSLILFEHVKNGEVMAYTVPTVGRGLWSTLYGYFALESDLNTVKGLTFYKHGETPGLGGEISKAWFQESFVGKKVLDASGGLRSVTVVKGIAADRHPKDLEHYVDGISGATITADGVTKMLVKTLDDYEPYFGKIRESAS